MGLSLTIPSHEWIGAFHFNTLTFKKNVYKLRQSVSHLMGSGSCQWNDYNKINISHKHHIQEIFNNDIIYTYLDYHPAFYFQ